MLLIAIISPALLGSEFRCVVSSGPTVATARIEQIQPVMPRVAETVHVTGSGNGTPPLQLTWDFGDGTLAVGAQAAHAYSAPGSYRVTFVVRDVNGNTAADAAQVTVSPRILSATLNPVLVSDAVAGQLVFFETLPLDERAGELRYVWTFSGGQSAMGPRAAAIFPVAGMYFASVTATNDVGPIAAAEIVFHVVDAAN
jgi:hypothetical protein